MWLVPVEQPRAVEGAVPDVLGLVTGAVFEDQRAPLKGDVAVEEGYVGIARVLLVPVGQARDVLI